MLDTCQTLDGPTTDAPPSSALQRLYAKVMHVYANASDERRDAVFVKLGGEVTAKRILQANLVPYLLGQ